MAVSTAPPVAEVDLTLTLGSRTVDLATRALVVGVVPAPRWARDAEVAAGVRAAADAGADLVDVPPEPRLVGPAAAISDVPVAVRVDTVEAARAAHHAGAALLLVPAGSDAITAGGGDTPETTTTAGGAGELGATTADGPGWQVATLASDAVGARDVAVAATGRPIALDVTRLSGVDAVAEESLGLAVGVRLVRTRDVHRTRRVVEVMAHLLEARR
jgi:hypothetical protein